MGAGNGTHRGAPDGDDELTISLREMIAQEFAVRDEALAFAAELQTLLPSDGPDADDFRTGFWRRAGELRTIMAEREIFLSPLPAPGKLYERVINGLDTPDCTTEAQHAALIAESASAALAAVAALVQLFAEMRRRGLPV
jgi:hypothetical protein